MVAYMYGVKSIGWESCRNMVEKAHVMLSVFEKNLNKLNMTKPASWAPFVETLRHRQQQYIRPEVILCAPDGSNVRMGVMVMWG